MYIQYVHTNAIRSLKLCIGLGCSYLTSIMNMISH